MERLRALRTSTLHTCTASRCLANRAFEFETLLIDVFNTFNIRIIIFIVEVAFRSPKCTCDVHPDEIRFRFSNRWIGVHVVAFFAKTVIVWLFMSEFRQCVEIIIQSFWRFAFCFNWIIFKFQNSLHERIEYAKNRISTYHTFASLKKGCSIACTCEHTRNTLDSSSKTYSMQLECEMASMHHHAEYTEHIASAVRLDRMHCIPRKSNLLLESLEFHSIFNALRHCISKEKMQILYL